jgi:hypothetical protein
MLPRGLFSIREARQAQVCGSGTRGIATRTD